MTSVSRKGGLCVAIACQWCAALERTGNVRFLRGILARDLGNAASFGWDLKMLVKDKKWFLLDAHVSPEVIRAGHSDLAARMLASIKAKADEMYATQIGFDSTDILLELLDDQVIERRATRW
jgi:hypothetical protein